MNSFNVSHTFIYKWVEAIYIVKNLSYLLGRYFDFSKNIFEGLNKHLSIASRTIKAKKIQSLQTRLSKSIEDSGGIKIDQKSITRTLFEILRKIEYETKPSSDFSDAISSRA